MTYLSDKAKKKKLFTTYVPFIGFVVVVALFWPMVKKYTYPIIEPAVVTYGGTKNSLLFFPEFFKTYFTSHQALVAHDRELEQEVEKLENELAESKAIVRESGLDSKDASSSDSLSASKSIIVAYPLMQDSTKVYSTIILSKGFKGGVDVGDAVTLRGNQIVCAIREVYALTSLCQLLSASGVVTEGVTSSSTITLTLVGRGGHYLADIARDTSVTAGEVVYLRSNPKMVLGTVKTVMNNNQDTSWHVFVEGAYNPVTSSLFYVQKQN